MISHALTIVINELYAHIDDTYYLGKLGDPTTVKLGNLAEGVTAEADLRNKLILSMVNIKEEKTLKNLPNHVRNDITLTTIYENPPVFLNFQILIAATHPTYTNALLVLSRAIRFFQFKNVFTQDNVKPDSITKDCPDNELDRLESFKLIFDLYSPTMEEVNHLWGTLGGKQYPFVLYTLRMLDLKFSAVQSERSVITEVVSDFYHKNPAVNS
ncbi:MAG: DUF4255 domain-containing protein [Methylococcaceae bacterium]